MNLLKEELPMWARLQKRHPKVYEAVEWGVLGLSVAAFLLALAVRIGWC